VADDVADQPAQVAIVDARTPAHLAESAAAHDRAGRTQDIKLDRSWRLSIFPVGLRGSAGTKETEAGFL
jgi:hypothetical protein